MRIIFVGLHSKKPFSPLSKTSKDGAKIQRVIDCLPFLCKVEKTNLFNIDKEDFEKLVENLDVLQKKAKEWQYVEKWYFENLPKNEDAIICIGHAVKNKMKMIKSLISKITILTFPNPNGYTTEEEIEKYCSNMLDIIMKKIVGKENYLKY